MSNWRINLGLGPVRYTRPIGGQPKRKKSALGAIVVLLVVGVAMYLCCWGGVALMSKDIQ